MHITITTFLKTVLFAICLISSSLIAISSLANTIEHVNVGRIEVADQSISSQQRAGKLALAQVFVKLSGNQLIVEAPEIDKAIDNFEQFLVSSSFLQVQDDLFFEATFNQQKVENLLLASGLSVWTSLRPSGIVWLAIEDENQQKTIVSQNRSEDIRKLVLQNAYSRGVELIIPLGDLQDSMNVSVYDVWNQYISKLQESSVRYGADYLVNATVQAYNQLQFEQDSMRLEALQAFESSRDTNTDYTQNNLGVPIPENTTHKLDYVIAFSSQGGSKQVKTGHLFASSQQQAVIHLVNLYADMLAKEFALSSGVNNASNSIGLLVKNIDSLEDYVTVVDLIKSIPAVSDVRLIKQTGSVAVLQIKQQLSASQLSAILSLDSRLRATSSAGEADPNLITFIWQG